MTVCSLIISELKPEDLRKTANHLNFNDALIFKIILKRKLEGSLHQKNHVDFSVNADNTTFNSRVDGVIGQFLNSDIVVSPGSNERERYFTINGQYGRVVQYERQRPGTVEKVACWHSHRNAQDLIQRAHEHYLVDEITSIPTFA
ncbi:unnamed protein product [Clavelina lepadiformis]|uniref:Inter-alpha-trypsin inhibitor heavy chain C-terminal domain-containing protein n=1 Tax=Clavelina lepadiformis TaxID=159417 RepID=A0ABP0GX03_CLALP